MITYQDINEIVENGKVILEKMPPVHGACLYISAMLVAMINDNTNLNAKLVTGSLSVQDKTIFSHSQSLNYYPRVLIQCLVGMGILG